MFNPMEAMFGGVQVVVVVFGLVEFIKNVLNLSGTKVTVLAAVLGVVVYGLVQLVGVVPEPSGQVLQIVFASVARCL